MASVLEAARRKAQIVVIDGGPALDLASTLQMTALADAVVMALPLSRQKNDALADLSRQLFEVRDKLLPVVTSPARRSARGTIVSADGIISMPGLSSPKSAAGTTIQSEPSVPTEGEREVMMFGSQVGGGSGGSDGGPTPPPPGPQS